MDPYLEAHWRDVHASLVIYTRDALQSALPGALRARVEERVVLETPQGLSLHPLFPDVRVVEYPPTSGLEAAPRGGLAVAEPLVVDTQPEPYTEPFIEIIDRESGNRVVTVIEYLSPANKIPGDNREQYLRKQSEICSSETNLVEINLNRFGIHTLAFPLDHLKPQARAPYMASVRRVTRPGKAEVYPMPLWERLPSIKIPYSAPTLNGPTNGCATKAFGSGRNRAAGNGSRRRADDCGLSFMRRNCEPPPIVHSRSVHFSFCACSASCPHRPRPLGSPSFRYSPRPAAADDKPVRLRVSFSAPQRSHLAGDRACSRVLGGS
jgi:hypothetical protein